MGFSNQAVVNFRPSNNLAKPMVEVSGGDSSYISRDQVGNPDQDDGSARLAADKGRL